MIMLSRASMSAMAVLVASVSVVNVGGGGTVDASVPFRVKVCDTAALSSSYHLPLWWSSPSSSSSSSSSSLSAPGFDFSPGMSPTAAFTAPRDGVCSSSLRPSVFCVTTTQVATAAVAGMGGGGAAGQGGGRMWRRAAAWRRVMVPPLVTLASTSRRDNSVPFSAASSSSSSSDRNSYNDDDNNNGLDNDNDDDSTILASVTKSYLQSLCRQFGVSFSSSDTKTDLLAQLRQVASNRASEEAKLRKANRERKTREIESGYDEDGNPTKHRLVDDDVVVADRMQTSVGANNGRGSSIHDSEDDNDDEVFYFELPRHVEMERQGGSTESDSSNSALNDNTKRNNADADANVDIHNRPSSAFSSTDNNPITVPPPLPLDVAPNKDGERVLTVYSTSDRNDLTAAGIESLLDDPGSEGMKGGWSKQGTRNRGTAASSNDGSIGNVRNKRDAFGNAAHNAGAVSGVDKNVADTTSGMGVSKKTEKEMEESVEILDDFIMGLLASTGLPGFRDELVGDREDDVEDDDMYEDVGLGNERMQTSQPYINPRSSSTTTLTSSSSSASMPIPTTTRFDPTSVPASLLSSSQIARALRYGRGEALSLALRSCELRAIGYDGTAGDDVVNGGGHYREVQSVGAFLNGYRKAIMARSARFTASMLLDKLVSEGVEGLDLILATMSRGDGVEASEWNMDGTYQYVELNDALLEYLDDAIRKQERKVEAVVGTKSSFKNSKGGRGENTGIKQSDAISNETMPLTTKATTTTTTTTTTLSKNTKQKKKSTQTTANEDDVISKTEIDASGELIETIDPNDPAVREAIMSENSLSTFSSYSSTKTAEARAEAAGTAPEKLLLLLTCLRDRVRAEAAFGTDEKGRNLRVLARVLHAPGGDEERENVLVRELGTSLDRLDSFLELVTNAIDYAEITAQRVLRPGSATTTGGGVVGGGASALNVRLLKHVHSMAEDVRDRQAWKASGISMNDGGRKGGFGGRKGKGGGGGGGGGDSRTKSRLKP